MTTKKMKIIKVIKSRNGYNKNTHAIHKILKIYLLCKKNGSYYGPRLKASTIFNIHFYDLIIYIIVFDYFMGVPSIRVCFTK